MVNNAIEVNDAADELTVDSLKDYLARAHAYNQPDCYALVLGNPSADMDSVMGAIFTAWYYGEFDTEQEGHLYSPVINIPRAELELRQEIWAHLEEFNMIEALENVFFLEEAMACSDTVEKVGLIDFNTLNKEFEQLGDKVELIFDHHVDDQLYAPTIRDIQTMGSASTLVLDKFDKDNWGPGLAQLASAPLLLDSKNFSNSKWRELD